MDLVIGKLVEKGMDLIDDIFTSDEEKAEAQLKLNTLAQAGDLQALNTFISVLHKQAEIITAEAKSEHWLTANWRPITMMVMLGLIVSRWFGWESDHMDPAEYLMAWELLKLGIGGYIVSRGVEKSVKEWKGTK